MIHTNCACVLNAFVANEQGCSKEEDCAHIFFPASSSSKQCLYFASFARLLLLVEEAILCRTLLVVVKL